MCMKFAYLNESLSGEYMLMTRLWVLWLDFYVEMKEAFASFFNFWKTVLNL